MAVARVRGLAPRNFMAWMIFSKKGMGRIESSSVHQFGGDRLGKLASLQACGKESISGKLVGIAVNTLEDMHPLFHANNSTPY